MKLVMIRHGESVWNQANLFTGWTDVELSKNGHKEAQSAGDLLRDNGFDFDICYTSLLKRAIHTLDIVLNEMSRTWLPVIKAYQLNERHYGDLQGKNKQETADQYGAEQVRMWRRSYKTLPPLLDRDDDRSPTHQAMYRGINSKDLPMAESLEMTVKRVVPYFEKTIKKNMLDNKRVLIVAHGNSLRALCMHFDNLSEEEIINLEIPTGKPLIYEFDQDFNVENSYYL